MRILLAYMFIAPIAVMYAVQNGAEQVTPVLVGLSVLAMIAQLIVEFRGTRA